MNPCIITVDGPSGVGKGTLSQMLAKKLAWRLLDSGALYRIVAHLGLEKGLDVTQMQEMTHLAECLSIAPDVESNLDNHSIHSVSHLKNIFHATTQAPLSPKDKASPNKNDDLNQALIEKEHSPRIFIRFSEQHTFLDDHCIDSEIRQEKIGILASKIASYGPLREALYRLQRSFSAPPGLVADGRDMGTAIFPEAALKFFLTATSQERAQRRFLQLQARKIHVSIHDLLQEIEARDMRDQTRIASPLKPAKDAIIIDTSALSINEVFQIIWRRVVETGGCGSSQEPPIT